MAQHAGRACFEVLRPRPPGAMVVTQTNEIVQMEQLLAPARRTPLPPPQTHGPARRAAVC